MNRLANKMLKEIRSQIKVKSKMSQAVKSLYLTQTPSQNTILINCLLFNRISQASETMNGPKVFRMNSQCIQLKLLISCKVKSLSPSKEKTNLSLTTRVMFKKYNNQHQAQKAKSLSSFIKLQKNSSSLLSTNSNQ